MPRKRKPSPPMPAVIVDTREQAPYGFAGLPDERPAAIIRKGIPSGDYSLAALGELCEACDGSGSACSPCYGTGRQVELMADRIAVERKSLIDLFGSVGRDRDRFEREIARLNSLERAAVVIEATLPQICKPATVDPYWPSTMNPKAVLATIVSWGTRYPNVHWHAAGDRDYGEYLTWSLLRTYWRHQAKRGKSQG